MPVGRTRLGSTGVRRIHTAPTSDAAPNVTNTTPGEVQASSNPAPAGPAKTAMASTTSTATLAAVIASGVSVTPGRIEPIAGRAMVMADAVAVPAR